MDPRAVPPSAPTVPEYLVDAAIYRRGKRVATLPGLDGMLQRLRAQPEQMAWIGLYRPAKAQLLAAAEEFGLHELAVEDAIVAHQPKPI
jgi:magnesium transporter